MRRENISVQTDPEGNVERMSYIETDAHGRRWNVTRDIESDENGAVTGINESRSPAYDRFGFPASVVASYSKENNAGNYHFDR